SAAESQLAGGVAKAAVAVSAVRQRARPRILCRVIPSPFPSSRVPGERATPRFGPGPRDAARNGFSMDVTPASYPGGVTGELRRRKFTVKGRGRGGTGPTARVRTLPGACKGLRNAGRVWEPLRALRRGVGAAAGKGHARPIESAR